MLCNIEDDALSSVVHYQKFHRDMCHVVCESIFVAFVLQTEVLGEENIFLLNLKH